MKKIALVLEGGGLRGIYTSGVLDFFIDESINFPYVIGVSMGACNAIGYLNKQRGRNKEYSLNFVLKKKNMRIRNLIQKKCYFDTDAIFNVSAFRELPLNFEAIMQSKEHFIIVATDCETGLPVYFDKTNCHDIVTILKASCSLPFLATIVTTNSKKMLDGGISDAIPIQKALDDGNEKLVIILTRSYEDKKKPFLNHWLINKYYKEYPNLVEALGNWHIAYNKTLQKINSLEKCGKAFVIRPSKFMKIKILERNKKRLEAIYSLGYQDAKENNKQLRIFLLN